MTPHGAPTRSKHRIGGYRVIAPIGAGGFATVYRALNESSREEVAIKVLAENHSLVPNTRRRFVDEVSLLSNIDSPAIAKIYEVGETDTGQPYMVLELADRGDLRRRLEEIRRNHQVLNRSDLTMLAHHLFDSLSTLHQAEIVHRDVSPGNILIRSRRDGRRPRRTDGNLTLLEPGERFLLADLGHAKDMILASGFTAGGGTRGYASPEQCDDVTVVDHRADIFSATAVLEWAAHDGEYAEDLEPFFDIGLAAEPDDRFDNMDEWHAAFCAALGATGAHTKSRFANWRRDSKATYLEVEDEPRTERTLAIAALVVVILGFAAIGLSAALNSNSDEVDDAAARPTETAASNNGAEDESTDEPGLLLVEGAEAVVGEDGTGQDGGSENPLSAPVDPEFANSPLAFIRSPADEAVITGDLLITGTANFDDGVRSVRVAVRNAETLQVWNPETGELQNEWSTFDAEIVNSTDTEVTWTFTVQGGVLPPGDYLIRAWARGTEGEGDPRGHSRMVVIS